MRTLAALLISTLFLNAQTTVSQQKGKALVDQVIAALGGDYFLAMRNRVETGRVYSFYREQLTGLSIAKIYTRYDINKAPGDCKAARPRAAGLRQEGGFRRTVPRRCWLSGWLSRRKTAPGRHDETLYVHRAQ